ncbi:MAG: pentapeptide repeat-containing protein [Patescibacteria group bacterium]
MAEIDITDKQVPGTDKTFGQVLGEILTSPDDNFVKLMEIAGLDGAKDFRYARLIGVELDDADISGWDLTGCDLTDADLSKVSNIDKAIFNKDTKFSGTRLPEGVSLQQLLSQQ